MPSRQRDGGRATAAPGGSIPGPGLAARPPARSEGGRAWRMLSPPGGTGGVTGSPRPSRARLLSSGVRSLANHWGPLQLWGPPVPPGIHRWRRPCLALRCGCVTVNSDHSHSHRHRHGALAEGGHRAGIAPWSSQPLGGGHGFHPVYRGRHRAPGGCWPKPPCLDSDKVKV